MDYFLYSIQSQSLSPISRGMLLASTRHGFFFSLFSPSQLAWTFAFLDHFPLPNTAQLQSAQKSDMLLFSIDLITDVVLPRLKTNTCTNNVPTSHNSWGDYAINALYWRQNSKNLSNVDGQLMKEFKQRSVFNDANSFDDFHKTTCGIRDITSQNASERYGCSARDIDVRSASTRNIHPFLWQN